MKTYLVSNIEYDTDGRKVNLPKTLEVLVPEEINADGREAIEQYISDEISNRTGYCHKGYNTVPEIPE
jgi:uncharacterized protein YdeI (YjbR/CyaY-like superfamily)